MTKKNNCLTPVEINKVRKLKDSRKLNIKEAVISHDDLAWLTARVLSLNTYANNLISKMDDVPVYHDSNEVMQLRQKVTNSDRMHKTLEKALNEALRSKKK